MLEAAASDAAVAWVSLQPLNEATHVASAIALSLGLSLAEGVDGFAALSSALDQTPVLLILDSAEHFGVQLATQLAGLVLHTQGLAALVTSQAPLGIAGETIYRLAALAVPDAGIPQADAVRYAAVELFAQRAAAADRRFELTRANTRAGCRNLPAPRRQPAGTRACGGARAGTWNRSLARAARRSISPAQAPRVPARPAPRSAACGVRLELRPAVAG